MELFNTLKHFSPIVYVERLIVLITCEVKNMRKLRRGRIQEKILLLGARKEVG